ncbi:MAG: hypothetical protein HFE63_04100 [Clostridiales bacterium]|nr:hypothetical protein [Clostridiales bacterium]
MQNDRKNDLRVEYSNFKNQRQTNQNMIPRGSSQPNYPNNRIYQTPTHQNQRPQLQQYRQINQPQYSTVNHNQQNRISQHNNRPQSIHLKSINQPPRTYNTNKKAKRKQNRGHSKFLDFLFGLLIGFAVFGTAAYFACKIIIDMFL